MERDLEATVLIVEDDRSTATQLRQIVLRMGCQVLDLVHSAASARERIRVGPAPDVLLLDIAMEHPLAGLELAESGVVPEETALVFISGKVDGPTLARVQEVAPAGFVVKPFGLKQVEAAILVGLGPRSGSPSPGPNRDLRHATAALEEIAVVLERFSHLVTPVEAPSRPLLRLASLSPREREVLNLLLGNDRVPDIATKLHISRNTVRNHLKSIFSKVGVHSQAELISVVMGAKDR
ncbi:MAG: response regulator transcription factor [Myxococcales bacterium]|nr:response regulator transcription factor [Myxococcales bacterium]